MRRYVDVFKEPPLEGSKNYNINVIVVIKLNIAEPNTVMLFIFKTLGMSACVQVKNAWQKKYEIAILHRGFKLKVYF